MIPCPRITRNAANKDVIKYKKGLQIFGKMFSRQPFKTEFFSFSKITNHLLEKWFSIFDMPLLPKALSSLYRQ
jgi:hypothetical protein